MGKKRGPDQKDYVNWYMQETGETEVDMHKVAQWLILKGYKAKTPPSQVDLLAKELSKQAREQTRMDVVSGDSYRAYHAFTQRQGDAQLTLWVDIDQAPRKPMQRSLLQRREQMVGDGVQLSLDRDHWNRIHPNEDPIQIDFDFTDDIVWRRNAPKDEKKAS
jgi:dienelactone hydrolase